MLGYCRGCNRDFKVEKEEYQEYWKEEKTGQLHPKIDCDVVIDMAHDSRELMKAALVPDLPPTWGTIREEAVNHDFSVFDPTQNPVRDEVRRSHYGKIKGDALPKKKKTATVVGDNTHKR